VESLGWQFGPREREWTAEEAANWLRAGGNSDEDFDFAADVDFEESDEDE
jgi:hypothetical protein